MHIDVIFSGIIGVVIGAIITYKLQNRLLNKQLAEQRRIAGDTLRLDLFDRRYKVYQAARNFVRTATYDDSERSEFTVGISGAEFLFDADVVDYLAQIWKRAVELRNLPPIHEKMADGDERNQLIEKEQAARLWLGEQITNMTNVFAPYLGFAHVNQQSLTR